ncbi:hypothetical protein OUQ99_01940 [Streptomonospora nanhaiensis]|uniref:Uncharacterized protein n=1 Tax=Streptomonospora nanhaiensis TaxID=1323731 RepID=A0ABY6YNJ4_9ACTN|nr:hypothetical protein [Streptomonospora nanhaiensis]WAE73913.1 hypothetical protein OUQ99_01940 [Streptomonospora nanhaiensis]
MADINRRTKALNSLLPRSLTPLNEVLERRLLVIRRELLRSTEMLDDVRISAESFVEAVRRQNPLSAPEAEVLSAEVVREAEAVHRGHRTGIENRERNVAELARTWGKPGWSSAQDANTFIRKDRDASDEAWRKYEARMSALKSRVHLDPGQRTGDPFVPRAADVPGARAVTGPVPDPRPALHDRPGRAPGAATGKTTVQPAARRRGPAGRRGRGTGA